MESARSFDQGNGASEIPPATDDSITASGSANPTGEDISTLGDVRETDAATAGYNLISSYYDDSNEFARQHAAFLKRFGIKEEFLCANFVGGFVMTGDDRIYSINNEVGDDAADIVALLEDAQRIEREVHWCLQGEELATERSTCIEMVGWAFATSFALLDGTELIADDAQRMEARSASSKGFRLPKGQLDYARSYFNRAAQRIAQLRYFRGVTIGGLAILGVALILAVLAGALFPVLDMSPSSLAPVLVSVIGGAAGAVVSVMSRMSFGKLNLDIAAERSQLVRLGAFRPIIGSVLGVALTVLMVGELLPISSPNGRVEELYFYGAIAFLAGFSERWAQDMLSRTEEQLSGGGKGDTSKE